MIRGLRHIVYGIALFFHGINDQRNFAVFDHINNMRPPLHLFLFTGVRLQHLPH